MDINLMSQNNMKIERTHYEKATDEIIKAVKELPIDECTTPFRIIDLRRAKKLIIKMLKANFIAKKSKWL